MFGPDTDYSLIDEGKQYYVCFQTAYLVASSASIFVRNIWKLYAGEKVIEVYPLNLDGASNALSSNGEESQTNLWKPCFLKTWKTFLNAKKTLDYFWWMKLWSIYLKLENKVVNFKNSYLLT